MFTLDQVKNATLQDVENNPALLKAVVTLYNPDSDPQRMLSYWKSGYRSFDADKNYGVSNLSNGSMRSIQTYGYADKYSNWNHPEDAHSMAQAEVQRRLGLEALSKTREFMISAGIDPNSFTPYTQYYNLFTNGMTAQQRAALDAAGPNFLDASLHPATSNSNNQLNYKIYVSNSGGHGLVPISEISITNGYNTPYGYREVTDFNELKQIMVSHAEYYKNLAEVFTQRGDRTAAANAMAKYNQMGGDALVAKINSGDISSFISTLESRSGNGAGSLGSTNYAQVFEGLKSGNAVSSGTVATYTHPVTGEVLHNVAQSTIDRIEANGASPFELAFKKYKDQGMSNEQAREAAGRETNPDGYIQPTSQSPTQQTSGGSTSNNQNNMSTNSGSGYQLKNQNIASANPSAIANSGYINALYQEAYNRNATQAELNQFQNKTVKDAANLILGQSKSPFASGSSGQVSNNNNSNNNTNSNTSNTSNNNNSNGGMNDQQILDLYRQYGFPAPDTNWVRTNLPSDEVGLRKVLQQQKDKITGGSSGSGNNNGNGQGQTGSGQGEQGGSSNYISDGNKIVVKFSDDPTPDGRDDTNTVWLYDKSDKTYRPFVSPSALANYLGISQNDIGQYINTIPTTVLNDSSWAGNFIARGYGIQDNGSIPSGVEYVGSTPGAPSTNKLSIYGQTKFPLDVETQAGVSVKMALTNMAANGAISKQTFDSLTNNPADMAKYINAWLYGGYTFEEVYRDIKAKDLSAGGNSQYSGIKGIDESIRAEEYRKTEGYQKAKSDPSLMPNAEVLKMDPDFFNNPIFKIPGRAFETLTPILDINSPEFKAEAEKIKASYYDILMEKANAETEQAKQIAENNWQILKKNIETKYSIQLSNNAREAWSTLQDLFTSDQNKGIADTGIEQEIMDRYLQDVRRGDKYTRESNLDEKSIEERNFLLKTGTPEQIKAFIDANPQKAQEWGLVPSAETKSYFDMANLKQLYPDQSDDMLQMMHDMVLDENGNYRSDLYRNLYSNKYNIDTQKKDYQTGKLIEQKTLEEEKAYAEFTKNNPFTSYNPSYVKDANGQYQAQDKPAPTNDNTTPSPNPMDNLGSGSTNNNSGAPAGLTLIPNVASMGNYTNITSPDANGKVYGILKTNTSAPTQNSGAPAGMTQIPNVASMGNYTNITSPDANGRIYGILKTNTSTPTSTPTSTYTPYKAPTPTPTPTPSTPTPTPTNTTNSNSSLGLKIHNPADLGKYSESDIVRSNGSIYLKPGIQYR